MVANKYLGLSWQQLAHELHRRFTKRMNLDPALDNAFLALALAGEVGELCNKLKKDWRGYATEKLDINDMASEMADVMIYLQIMADLNGINLDNACSVKMQECLRRWPEVWED